jgi:hypothetical protein
MSHITQCISVTVDGVVYPDVSVALLAQAQPDSPLAQLAAGQWPQGVCSPGPPHFSGKFPQVLTFLSVLACQSGDPQDPPMELTYILKDAEERQLLACWGALDGPALDKLVTVEEVCADSRAALEQVLSNILHLRRPR